MTGGEFPRTGHRAAELGDPAVGDPDVSDLLVTGRHDGGTADYEVKSHQCIVACGGASPAEQRPQVVEPVEQVPHVRRRASLPVRMQVG